MNWFKNIKFGFNKMKIAQNFNWITSDDYSPDSHQIITVNIDKFDQAWQKNPYYVPEVAKEWETLLNIKFGKQDFNKMDLLRKCQA